MRTKIFLCLFNDGSLGFQSKEAVEAEIKYMEEEVNNTLAFTVVGSLFEDELDQPHMFVIFTTDHKTTIYDVLKASSKEEVEQILHNKKRLAGKAIKIQRCMSLSTLIEKYAEN